MHPPIRMIATYGTDLPLTSFRYILIRALSSAKERFNIRRIEIDQTYLMSATSSELCFGSLGLNANSARIVAFITESSPDSAAVCL